MAATTGALPANENVTVTYTMGMQPTHIQYVDDDNGGEQVGALMPLFGNVGASVNWSAYVPSGYTLAQGQAGSGTYKFAAKNNANIVIHLVHAKATGEAVTTTYTVNYKGLPADQTPTATPQQVEWQATTDEATGKTVYVPAADTVAAVTSPTVAGYTPDQTATSVIPLMPMNNVPTDGEIVVTYTADAQSTHIQYVDDDQGQAQVGALGNLYGTTDATANWTANVPAGYTLADGQATTGTYKFAAKDNADIVIHLVHVNKTDDLTTNYTVTYKGLPADLTPTSTPQTLKWQVTTDEVTGKTVYVPATDKVAAVTSPTVAGYTPDQTATPVISLMSMSKTPTDIAVVVTYTADMQSTHIQYVDDDQGQAQVGALGTLFGNTDATTNWIANVPAGYALADGQAATGTYKFAVKDNANIVIHLVHAKTNGESVTTTYTISYKGLSDNLKPAAVPQQVEWQVTTDEATKKTAYVPVTDTVASVTTPTVAGYTPDLTATPAIALTPMFKAPTDGEIVVIFTPNMQQVHVKYVDDDNNEVQVGSLGTLAGRTDSSTTWAAVVPSGYVLASGQAAKGTYDFKAENNQDLVIHLAHALATDTVTATYTVAYTGLPDALLPKAVTHTVDWTKTTDEATGQTAYTPSSATVAAVITPTIPGYAADIAETDAITLTLMMQAPTDLKTTVAYHPVETSLTVTYLDEATHEKVATAKVTGLTGVSGEYEVSEPANYILADNQPAKLDYTLSADDTDNLIVYVARMLTHDTQTTTRTINYVVTGDNAPAAPATVTQTIDWKTATDHTTGQTVATPHAVYGSVKTPTLAGYTPTLSRVALKQFPVTVGDLPKDEVITITYDPNESAQTVTYVDDDQGGAVIGTATTQSGKVGNKVTFTVHVPDNYALVPGQDLIDGQVVRNVLTATKQNLKIHLMHKLSHGTAQTTRTITYVVNGDNQPDAPAEVTQTIDWKTTTDQVTKQTVSTPHAVYGSVDTPALTGYTPDLSQVESEQFLVTIGELPKDEAITVTYSPNAALQTVTYVDDSNAGAIVGTPTTQEGGVGDEVTFTVRVPENYELAPGQDLTDGQVVHNILTATTQNVKIHLIHKLTHAKANTTRTITYVVNGDNHPEAPAEVTQTINWKTTTDLVTKQTVSTPHAVYGSVDTPALTGYTPDLNQVDLEQFPVVTGDLPKDEVITVTYNPNAALQTVTYVDDSNAGAIVGTPATQEGGVGDEVSFTVRVPENYELAPGQDLTDGQVVRNILTATTQNVKIHLIHKLDHGTATTTRTITYVVNGDNQPDAPAEVTQIIDWKTTTDLVTKQTVSTPHAVYGPVETPTLTGYTPDLYQVELEQFPVVTGALPENEAITVTYNPNAALQTVTYVDDDRGGAVVGTPATQEGGVGDEVSFTVHVPHGYELVPGQELTDGQVLHHILTATTHKVTIHLTHKMINSTTTTTRTVRYVVDGGTALADAIETVTWNVIADDVTGQATATPQDDYAQVVSPEVPGYQPDMAVVDQEELEAQPLGSLADETVTVTYTGKADALLVTYIEKGETPSGNRILKTELITGKTGDSGEYTVHIPEGLAGNYQPVGVALGDKIPYTLTPSADGIVIYLDLPSTDTPGGGDGPATDNPGGGDGPSTDNPGGGDGPATDNPGGGDGPSTNNPGGGDGPSTDNPGGGEGPSTDNPGGGEGPSTDNPGGGEGPSTDNPGGGEGPSTDNPSGGDGPSTDNPGGGEGPSTDNPGGGEGPATDNPGGGEVPTTDNPGGGDTPRGTLPDTDGDQPQQTPVRPRHTLPNTDVPQTRTTRTGMTAMKSATTNSTRRQLPQTGDQAATGLTLLGSALLGLLGLAGWKRKKERN